MCTFAASNGGPAVQLPNRAREAEPEFALAGKVVQGTVMSNLIHLTDPQFCCPNPVRPLGYPNRSRLPREHGPAGLDQGGRSGGRSGGQGLDKVAQTSTLENFVRRSKLWFGLPGPVRQLDRRSSVDRREGAHHTAIFEIYNKYELTTINLFVTINL